MLKEREEKKTIKATRFYLKCASLLSKKEIIEEWHGICCYEIYSFFFYLHIEINQHKQFFKTDCGILLSFLKKYLKHGVCGCRPMLEYTVNCDGGGSLL